MPLGKQAANERETRAFVAFAEDVSHGLAEFGSAVEHLAEGGAACVEAGSLLFEGAERFGEDALAAAELARLMFVLGSKQVETLDLLPGVEDLLRGGGALPFERGEP